MKRALRLTKVVRGLYMDVKHGVTLEHEVAWRASEGRKWVATWNLYGLMGLAAQPDKRSKKFESAADGRAFLRRLVAEGREP